MLTAAIVSFVTAGLLVAVLAPAEARSARETNQQR
jgi:MFS transporter, DHA2 family, methylenomycin A resistance protein